MSQSLKCTPRKLRKFVEECLSAGLVPYIRGSPGIGKSEITRMIADDYKLWVIDHRVSTSEPTDATGLPKFFEIPGVGEFSKFAPFADLFPVEGMPVPKGYQGWMLFLDEFSSAPRQVQAAFYKLILDRMVGQHKLHRNVAIVAAGNLSTDRAIVNPISTAMQSRLIHVELEVDFKEWLQDVAIPQKYDPRVIGYLMQYPSKLMDFKPDHHEFTFCCPRTWSFVNRLISETDQAGNRTQKQLTDDSLLLLSGTITSGVAMEFLQFTKVYADLISVNEILADPKTCRIPLENNIRWALLTHLMEKVTLANFGDLATYINRFDTAYKVLFYRYLLVQKKELRTHPAFGPAAAAVSHFMNS